MILLWNQTLRQPWLMMPFVSPNSVHAFWKLARRIFNKCPGAALTTFGLQPKNVAFGPGLWHTHRSWVMGHR
jgi:hypothetical protein